MSKPVRVRFAPSPTGPLHMGGVRTALYNYLFAKKHNGTFLIRIEDTDQTRFVPGAQDYIMDALSWCGIMPSEGPGLGGDFGPYVQSERKAMYRPYAEELVANEKAYYAFDTAEELEQIREQAKQMGMPNWQYNSVTRTSMKNSLLETKGRTQNLGELGEVEHRTGLTGVLTGTTATTLDGSRSRLALFEDLARVAARGSDVADAGGGLDHVHLVSLFFHHRVIIHQPQFIVHR